MKTYTQLNQEISTTLNQEKWADYLFEKAIHQENKGKGSIAIDIAKEALIHASYANSYTKVYIHSFLALKYIDFNQFHIAKTHCWHAIQALDKTHKEYPIDIAYIQALEKKILLNIETKSHRKKKKAMPLAA